MGTPGDISEVHYGVTMDFLSDLPYELPLYTTGSPHDEAQPNLDEYRILRRRKTDAQTMGVGTARSKYLFSAYDKRDASDQIRHEAFSQRTAISDEEPDSTSDLGYIPLEYETFFGPAMTKLEKEIAPALMHVFVSCKISVAELLPKIREKVNNGEASKHGEDDGKRDTMKQLANIGSSGSARRSSTRNKRKQDDEETWNDGSDEDSPRPSMKRLEVIKGSQKERIACPFQKYRPRKYCGGPGAGGRYKTCTRGFRDTKDLSDHLKCVHNGPKFLCRRCSIVFRSQDATTKHSQGSVQCDLWINPEFAEEGYIMCDARRKALRKKLPSASIEQHWYGVWDILFPDRSRPPSIYRNLCQLEEAYDLAVEAVIPGFIQTTVVNIRDMDLPTEERELYLRHFARTVRDRLWESFDDEVRSRISDAIRSDRETMVTSQLPGPTESHENHGASSVALVQSTIAQGPGDLRPSHDGAPLFANIESMLGLEPQDMQAAFVMPAGASYLPAASMEQLTVLESQYEEALTAAGSLTTGPDGSMPMDVLTGWDHLSPASYMDALARTVDPFTRLGSPLRWLNSTSNSFLLHDP